MLLGKTVGPVEDENIFHYYDQPLIFVSNIDDVAYYFHVIGEDPLNEEQYVNSYVIKPITSKQRTLLLDGHQTIYRFLYGPLDIITINRDHIIDTIYTVSIDAVRHLLPSDGVTIYGN